MGILIAVVAGGDSHEEVISLRSCETIMKYLDANRYTAVKVLIKGKNWKATWMGQDYPIDRNDFSFTVNGEKKCFAGVYIIIHGTPGEDGLLPAYFDLMKIPHSTNAAFEGSLTFNKYVCNLVAVHYGAVIAPSVLLDRNDVVHVDEIREKIGFPCFIKPNDSGSSFGVTKVKSPDEVLPAVKHAFEHGSKVIIEKFVSGVEVSCGVLRLRGEIHVLPVTEIVPKAEFFDFAAKYEGASQEITPARISETETKEVQRYTRLLYERMNLRGLTRIDFIIEKGIPYLIEINTIPGMSEQSIVPQQIRANGWDLGETLTGLVDEMLKA